MTRTCLTLLLALGLSGALAAQDGPNIRNPTINTESEEGKPLVAAGLAESAAERVPILEGYLQQFPQGQHRGYALFQAQKAYLETGQNDKAVETGKELMKMVPDDLEVRHNVNQALVQLQDWDQLHALLDEARPIAEKQVSAPEPAGGDEEALGHWKAQKEYAEGVVQWLEWATNAAATQETDPKAKVEWLDRLMANFPEGQYAKGIESQYVIAYQQMGDQENMVAWMKKAVEGGSQDETYYYTLGEDAVNKGDADAAKAYADKALEVLEAKPVPEGVAEEQWAAQKEKMTAYINFLLGRIYMPKNTKDAYRTARSYMLKSVDVLKAEGGPRYHVLAYFLGVCYVQLDIQGDNIKQALFWMNEAARTDGQFKAQAAEAVKKINAAR
jgi:tetratricopeptide (TPR) repeat protein